MCTNDGHSRRSAYRQQTTNMQTNNKQAHGTNKNTSSSFSSYYTLTHNEDEINI